VPTAAMEAPERTSAGASPPRKPHSVTTSDALFARGPLLRVDAAKVGLAEAYSPPLETIVKSFTTTNPDAKQPPLRERLAVIWPRALAHFTSKDELGTGRVAKPEFRRAIAMLGLIASRADVDALFTMFETDLNGTVSYGRMGEMLKPAQVLAEKVALKRALAGSLTKMVDCFKQWDKDGNGQVSREEFRRAVGSMLPASDDACDAVFGDYDVDGSGEIGYQEYVRHSLRDALKSSFSRVSDLFRKWDVDESGTIEKKEFREVIRSVGFEAPADVVDELFAEMDRDGSGEVEFKELNRVLRQGADIKLVGTLQAGAAGVLDLDALRASKGCVSPPLARSASSSSAVAPAADVASSSAPAANTSKPNPAKPLPALRANGSSATAVVPPTKRSLAALVMAPNDRPPPPSLHREQRQAVPSARLIEAKGLLKHALASSLNSIVDVFGSWDADGNGRVSRDEFQRAVSMLGLSGGDTEEACDAVFDEHDLDGSGEISYREYVRHSLRDALARSSARVMDVIEQWDVDGSGYVERAEFHRAVAALGFDAPASDLDEVFDEMDADASGLVDFGELSRVLHQGADIQPPPATGQGLRSSKSTSGRAASPAATRPPPVRVAPQSPRPNGTSTIRAISPRRSGVASTANGSVASRRLPPGSNAGARRISSTVAVAPDGAPASDWVADRTLALHERRV